MESRLTGADVCRLCVDNGWLTYGVACGGYQQYAKIMQAADNGMDTHDIAVAIWTCSDAIDLDDIQLKIKDYLRWEKPQAGGRREQC